MAALQGFAAESRADGPAEAIDIEAEVGKQFAAFGVFNKAIRQAEADDPAGVEPGGVRRFQNRAAKPAFQRPLFDRDHDRQLLNGPRYDFGVERFYEPGIDDADLQALFSQFLGGFDGGREK